MSIKFLAGMAVGGIIVSIFSTAEGRAFLRRIRNDITRTEEDIEYLADGLVQKGKSLVNKISGKQEEVMEEQLIVVVESNPVV